MGAEYLLGALIMTLASFVYGLTGFGIGLVALSLLPFFMPPVTIVPLVTIYGAVFALVTTWQLRRDILFPHLRALLVGAVLGTPVGVWILSTCPPSLLRHVIGAILMSVAVLEWGGLYPRHLIGRRWSLGAGGLAGVLGGALGTPGPPVILYAVAQGWPPRLMKAMLQAFFFVHYSVILTNHWLVGLVTPEVIWLACLYAVPAAVGLALGDRLFAHINQPQFRRLLFAMLFVLGVLMHVRG